MKTLITLGSILTVALVTSCTSLDVLKPLDAPVAEKKHGAHGKEGHHGLGHIFGHLDEDKSGALSYEEFFLPSNHKDAGTTTEAAKEKEFGRLDTDGDGVLSKGEFTAQRSNHYHH